MLRGADHAGQGDIVGSIPTRSMFSTGIMKLKNQHDQSIRELAKLLRSARSAMGQAELEADRQSINQILFDSGNTFAEQAFIVCSVVSSDSFCAGDSDVLYQIADEALDGALDDDYEVGQMAISLMKSDPRQAIRELSKIETAKAVAVIAKLGLFNPGYVGRLATMLESAHENAECLGE